MAQRLFNGNSVGTVQVIRSSSQGLHDPFTNLTSAFLLALREVRCLILQWRSPSVRRQRLGQSQWDNGTSKDAISLINTNLSLLKSSEQDT
mmetsp:Transcript_9703/g.41619  ORF Transcript_9703/g.41619 Transcript_9703/m.41619 type:complete len:91 (-) Transcript_9703:144-416(-)